MTDKKELTEVASDLVVAIEYKLTVDGEMIDSSDDGPLEYLHGHSNIIYGLEKELTGMKIGESKKVEVSPEEGYGEVDPEAVLEVPRTEFPDDVPLEPGIELEITDDEGDMMFATIMEVGEENVLLDTNHPLAGQTLFFEVSVVGLREAEQAEIEHGHVHFDHDHDHDDD
ncbi:MAG: peptidylprolyl isomerase [Anaerolineales bacterium]|nr:peptidylprolyl isomerase [Anaerolineales bacterium]